MFAVIKTGGKQYKVKEGDTLRVEKLPEVEAGGSVTFDEVLLVGNEDGSSLQIGMPTVSGATVAGTVETQGRAKKVVVRKFKAKSRYYKTRGHRQPFTQVKIGKISA